jgi:hypothetical protein
VTAKDEKVREALAWLERHGTRRTREGMARYGIVADKAFGVPVGAIQQLGKRLGRDHDLAAALWETGWYEARMLCAYVDEPARVTAAQMDRWARDFDNWGITDTLCFALFDRTPHAWKVEQWSRRRDELVKRAAFALRPARRHDKRPASPSTGPEAHRKRRVRQRNSSRRAWLALRVVEGAVRRCMWTGRLARTGERQTPGRGGWGKTRSVS